MSLESIKVRVRVGLAHLVGDVIRRQFLQHVVGQFVDHTLARLATSTARVFRLDAHNVRQHRVGCVCLVPEDIITKFTQLSKYRY